MLAGHICHDGTHKKSLLTSWSVTGSQTFWFKEAIWCFLWCPEVLDRTPRDRTWLVLNLDVLLFQKLIVQQFVSFVLLLQSSAGWSQRLYQPCQSSSWPGMCQRGCDLKRTCHFVLKRNISSDPENVHVSVCLNTTKLQRHVTSV